jgi:DNA replication protein DnaC
MDRRFADPKFIAVQQAKETERVMHFKANLKAAKKELVATFQLPAKDIELLWNGLIVDTAAVEALRDGGMTFIVLSGGTGSGKTVAAATWLYRWATDPVNWREASFSPEFVGGRGLFVTAARLSRWSKYNSDEMDRLLGCARLAVDDLGAEYLDEKGSYLSLLDELINERYSHRRITVMTTNLDAAQFRSRYGERITDRIRECGRFVSVGPISLRKKP